MNRRKFINMTLLSSVALVIQGCSTRGVTTGQKNQKGPPPHAPAYGYRHKQKGPPPHAPAHGYRRKNQDGFAIQFDPHIGVYILLNYPMHYYWNGIYYRKNKNRWESTKDINKKWKRVEKQKMPKGLQRK